MTEAAARHHDGGRRFVSLGEARKENRPCQQRKQDHAALLARGYQLGGVGGRGASARSRTHWVAGGIKDLPGRGVGVTEDERYNAGVVALAPLIYLALLSLGLLLNRRLRFPFLPQAATRTVGWSLIGSGALLLGWFFRTLRSADTPADPRKPASRLVTSGPFRYTRNPAYLADTMIYVGISSLANALPAILLLPVALVVIQRGVVEREERYLERTFGEEYLNYKASVRRWV